MRISTLEIADLRVIEKLRMVPCAGLNFIIGGNGAGKTSILEAIYLAGRGKTFRHAEAGPMIRQGKQSTTVIVGLEDEAGERKSLLGIRRERKVLTCRLDRQDVTKRSVLAETLPVQWIGSQPQLFLAMGPEMRRRFIDMGLFHVEQSYLDILSGFQRILRQRNAAIRTGISGDVRLWDSPFYAAATRISRFRETFIADLMGRVGVLISTWQPGFEIGYRYRRGWPAHQDLRDQLTAKLDQDLRLGYSSIGPQRAELELLADGTIAERKLSRGQQKMLVLALHLALMDCVIGARGYAPVLLVDDLAAELDIPNRERIIAEIEARQAQSFLTMIEEDALVTRRHSISKTFHVEHGRLSEPPLK